jgi:hypothetical protein
MCVLLRPCFCAGGLSLYVAFTLRLGRMCPLPLYAAVSELSLAVEARDVGRDDPVGVSVLVCGCLGMREGALLFLARVRACAVLHRSHQQVFLSQCARRVLGACVCVVSRPPTTAPLPSCQYGARGGTGEWAREAGQTPAPALLRARWPSPCTLHAWALDGGPASPQGPVSLDVTVWAAPAGCAPALTALTREREGHVCVGTGTLDARDLPLRRAQVRESGVGEGAGRCDVWRVFVCDLCPQCLRTEWRVPSGCVVHLLPRRGCGGGGGGGRGLLGYSRGFVLGATRAFLA